ncbi:MAG: uroporphyrinogen decarboxylase family protein [Thermodesulfobacteriota bacterium]
MSLFDQGFERLSTALNGIPDRVPFTTQMHELAMQWTGQSPRRFYTDPETLVRGIVDTAADLEFDIPSLGYDVYNIEAEALGAPVLFFDAGSPSIDEARPVIADKDDLKKIKWPDSDTAGRVAFVTEIQHLFQEKVGHPPPIQFTAPFSLAVILRGYQQLITDIYTDPGFVHRLLTVLTDEILTPWIGILKQESPESTTIRGADALASFPLVNLAIFEAFVVPYVLRLKEKCKEPVTVLNWWGESHLPDPVKLLQQKRIVSPALVQGQDPDVLKLGPNLYKNFATENGPALSLGIGDTFLKEAGPDEIRARISDLLAVCKPGGKLILYFCNLTTTTPVDHLKTAIKTIKENGGY